MTAFVTGGAGFLLAVLWFDLMFDVQVIRHRGKPELPEEVVTGTRARYVEAFERLTGIRFEDYLADPEVVTT